MQFMQSKYSHSVPPRVGFNVHSPFQVCVNQIHHQRIYFLYILILLSQALILNNVVILKNPTMFGVPLRLLSVQHTWHWHFLAALLLCKSFIFRLANSLRLKFLKRKSTVRPQVEPHIIALPLTWFWLPPSRISRLPALIWKWSKETQRSRSDGFSQCIYS